MTPLSEAGDFGLEKTLELRDFSFCYGGRKNILPLKNNANTKNISAAQNNANAKNISQNLILSHISISIKKGDFICLCGPNGAGKSTLLRCLRDQGIISPENHVSPKDRSKSIAFLTQNESPLWDYTVFDTILSGRFPYTSNFGNYSKTDYKKAQEAMEIFQLEQLKDKSILEISGGELQKVRIARCFAQDSDFLLLDEPLSSLDFVFSYNIMKLLKEKCRLFNKGVLVSVHDLNTAALFADKLFLLNKAASENNVSVQNNAPTKNNLAVQNNAPTKNNFPKNNLVAQNNVPAQNNSPSYLFGTTTEIFTEENISRCYNSPVKIFAHPIYGVPQICK